MDLSAAEKKFAAYNRRYDAHQCRAFAGSSIENVLLQAVLRQSETGRRSALLVVSAL